MGYKRRVLNLVHELIHYTWTYNETKRILSENPPLQQALKRKDSLSADAYADIFRQVKPHIQTASSAIHMSLKAIQADGNDDFFFQSMRKRHVDWGPLSYTSHKSPGLDGMSGRFPVRRLFLYPLKDYTMHDLYREPVQDALPWIKEEMYQLLQELINEKKRAAGIIQPIPEGSYSEEEWDRIDAKIKAKEQENAHKTVTVTADELIEAIAAHISRDGARIKYITVDTHLIDKEEWDEAYKTHFPGWYMKQRAQKRREYIVQNMEYAGSVREYLYVDLPKDKGKTLKKIEEYADIATSYIEAEAMLSSQGKDVGETAVIDQMAKSRPNDYTDIAAHTVRRSIKATESLLENLQKGIFPGNFTPNK